ncbi:FecR family protein [Pedobacter caeni]|uniref:FecR family protein n=2 Tax=Pedobacter caeni TaxID=288992 RepID=A0A1M4X3T8_9SPHI|nr:FecR family protein [Pedobacter caeni]
MYILVISPVLLTMKNENLPLLIEKYINGTASPQEREQLLDWYRSQQPEQVEWPAATETEETETYNRMLSGIDQQIDQQIDRTYKAPVPQTKWYYMAAAAAVFLVGSLAVYFYNDQPAAAPMPALSFKNEVKPGGNKAILTLADGSEVVLDGATKESFAHQQEVNIARVGEGQLSFDRQSDTQIPASTAVKYNVISTPKGGQYRVVLPDGTKVWLNAVSSIRFPSYFSAGERKVEISGEVYFEVTKNKTMPFRVISGDQALEVLGTKFNVNAYANEGQISTTLAEGSVRLKRSSSAASSILKPGEQSQLKTGKSKLAPKIVTADLEEVLAWKNETFIFNDTPITEVMQQIERWYDVELVYSGHKPDLLFTGIIPRNSNLSTFLKVLEGTGGLKFGIDHQKVIIQSIR